MRWRSILCVGTGGHWWSETRVEVYQTGYSHSVAMLRRCYRCQRRDAEWERSERANFVPRRPLDPPQPPAA